MRTTFVNIFLDLFLISYLKERFSFLFLILIYILIWWGKNEIIIQILLLDLSKKWNFSFIKWFVKSRDFSLLKLSGTEVKSQHRQNWTRNLSYPAVHSLGKPKKLVHVNITYVFKTNILSSVMTKKYYPNY